MNFGNQDITNLLSSFPHKHEALRVRNNFGGIQCLLKVINELLLVAVECLFLRATDDFAGAHALILDSRQATCEHSLTNESDYSFKAFGQTSQLVRMSSTIPAVPASRAAIAVHFPVPF